MRNCRSGHEIIWSHSEGNSVKYFKCKRCKKKFLLFDSRIEIHISKKRAMQMANNMC